MNQISSFFDKFKNLLQNGTRERQSVSDVVFAVLGVRIEPSLIVIKGRTAIIPTNPIIRTELKTKKPLIEEELRRRSIEGRISEIR